MSMLKYTPTKFEFTVTSCDGTVSIRRFEKDTLPEILEEFEYFLRGAGFSFDGVVDVVKDDLPDPNTPPELETGTGHPGFWYEGEDEPPQKSKYYYDKDRNK